MRLLSEVKLILNKKGEKEDLKSALSLINPDVTDLSGSRPSLRFSRDVT